MNFNKVILVGRLTRDPENKALPSGQSLTSFGMATSRFFTDKDGQKQQQADFHNIVLFGKLADIAAQYLNKGSLALIEGRLQTRTWQDSSGNKRSRTEIVGERLQLGPKSGYSAEQIRPDSAGQESSQSPEKTAENKKPEREKSPEDIPVIEEDEEIDISKIPF